ncbi:hypothetical protein GQX73_g1694 [Xylaria multiplex]|uniref:ATP-dependent DNA ligase family profile domain-containing protein n=1 Tax=Xylaria multiplex TaxID=323545 RepID=A0A7C8ITC8_9PEZI|nr:hypothetical protein GQX73_g1694 [Xylaria multiplex]
MPFPYRYICDLLQQLDDEGRKPPEKQASSDTIVKSWFQQHRCLINAPGNDACAILSTLLPERRTDRVYNIQAPKLQSIFGKALMLGASRVLELRRWTESGCGVDLADCVESALRRTPNSRDDTTHLTVEEIDQTLGRIAAACRFSSPAEHKILPFHKIRKHVSRSGSFLGTANDSQAHEYEHLMIIYYDVLLIDDGSLLGVKNSERFRRLSEIVTCREGYAELVSRTTIYTSRPSAVPALRELFAQCISSRGEGLVLKPDEPYFDFNGTNRQYGCCNIKLKKEYIQGWGDVGDFAVVGASYDAAKAREYKLPNVRWTHFFIGCLENRDQARAKTEIPRFRVTNIVELTGPVLSTFWAQQRPISVPCRDNTFFELDYGGSVSAKKPTIIFPCPLIFDMRCFAFDKESNTNFWSMRFPQVAKVHHDRSYLDTITFRELQDIAEDATHVPEEDSQEARQWVKALEKMDRGKFLVDTPSQATTCSDVPSSPSSSTSTGTTAQQPRRDVSMPPRSSVVQATITSADTHIASSTVSTSHQAKRLTTEQSRLGCAAKRRRRCSGTSSIEPSQQNAPAESAHTRHREPLSQVDLNVSEKHHAEPQHHPSTLSLTTSSTQEETDLCITKHAISSPVAYYTASEMPSSSPTRIDRSRRISVTAQSQSKSSKSNSSCCSVARHECALASCSILLSPCISSYAWITDDLLKRHGIDDPLLDPRVWHSIDSPMSTYRSASNVECESTPKATSGRRRRMRKICLVESRRKEATEAFLQKIKDADLKKRNGEREWVAVYDWRVLETITEQESQEKTSRGKDPWRRFYVGIV